MFALEKQRLLIQLQNWQMYIGPNFFEIVTGRIEKPQVID